MAGAIQTNPDSSPAPNYSLYVGKKGGRLEVAQGIRELISQIEYESVDGIADLMKFTIDNPADSKGNYVISDSQIFAPGNEVSISFGYGTRLRHVGRAIIRRCRPVFPGDGPSFVEVVGYTKDMLMADSKPVPLKERKKSKRKKQGTTTQLKNANASARFSDMTYADAVIQKAEEYGMIADVDPTGDSPHDFIQKAGMTDYDFVRGLSNLTGFYFWVDGDAEGDWHLHFKNPETIDQGEVQESEFTFTYNNNDFSSITNFEPELAIQEAIVKFKVTSKDPVTGRLFEVTIEEDGNNSPDVEVIIGGTESETATSSPAALTPEGRELDKDYSSASDVKLFVGDFSFDIRANRIFRDEQDLARWALSWFRRQRENFILGRLETIGVETLMARQVHKLEGVGKSISGQYFFTRVRHVFSGQSAYKCDSSVRKIIKQKPATEELQEAFDLGDVEQ